MNKKILFFLIIIILSTTFIFSQDYIEKRIHSQTFFGINYQLEFGEYLAKPIKFYGGSVIYDFKPKHRIGWKVSLIKEYSWLGDGWELDFIPRLYIPFRESEGFLKGIIGLGIAHKIPSRLYSSYNIELQEHVYLKHQQLLGRWTSLILELGLRNVISKRISSEATLIFKPLNFFIVDKTKINCFVSANLSLLYCVRK
jgi:hypothetical protein